MVTGCPNGGALDTSRFSDPMPWIGMYIAAATVACAIFMLCDLWRAVHNRMPWLPCKFFAVNALTLTLLGIAVKLSVDLNTAMPQPHNQLAKLCSSALLCTAMANFMPSLSSTDLKTALSNVIALGLLVVTVFVNLCIQLRTGVIYQFRKEHVTLMFLMLLELLTSISFCIGIVGANEITEGKFKSKCPNLEQESCSTRRVSRFWMLAQTRNPEFVAPRTVDCQSSGAYSIATAVVLVEATVRTFTMNPSVAECSGDSDYRWSIEWIVWTQIAAVGIGTVAPAYRFLFPFSEVLKDDLEDSYYEFIRVAVLERGGFIGAVAVYSVVIHPFVTVISCLVTRIPSAIKHLWACIISRGNPSPAVNSSGDEMGLADYALHFEGGENLKHEMKKLIEGHMKVLIKRVEKPTNLILFLEKMKASSTGFHGLRSFESKDVPHLDPNLESEELTKTWLLPIITLTSIAMATSARNSNEVTILLEAVDEAVRYIDVVDEEFLCGRSGMLAMESLWIAITQGEWMKLDLRAELHGDTAAKTLDKLRDAAEVKFQEKQGSLHLQAKAISLKLQAIDLATNSMHRICQTMLLSMGEGSDESNESLHRRVVEIIGDMIWACLLNMPRALTSIISHQVPVEKRVANSNRALVLLHETEEIMRILAHRDPPAGLDPFEMHCIDAWRRELGNGEDRHQPPASTPHHHMIRISTSCPELMAAM